MTYLINNISFVLTDTHQEFSFTKSFAKNEWGCATLQLPDTGDSQHSICDININESDWGDEESAIFNQLKEFFFNSFKDTECAAASALLAKEIIHVEEVDGFYVAFSLDNTYLIKESPCRSYYNKAALFDHVYDFDFESVNEDKLKEKAQKEFFLSLERALTKEMQNYLDKVFKAEGTIIDDALIDQAFDEILHNFMKANFECDYSGHALADAFYQFYGCDTRINFEVEAREALHG